MIESLDGDEKISSCKSNYFSAATQVFFCLQICCCGCKIQKLDDKQKD
jgi:hypothetical protein